MGHSLIYSRMLLKVWIFHDASAMALHFFYIIFLFRMLNSFFLLYFTFIFYLSFCFLSNAFGLPYKNQLSGFFIKFMTQIAYELINWIIFQFGAVSNWVNVLKIIIKLFLANLTIIRMRSSLPNIFWVIPKCAISVRFWVSFNLFFELVFLKCNILLVVLLK